MLQMYLMINLRNMPRLRGFDITAGIVFHSRDEDEAPEIRGIAAEYRWRRVRDLGQDGEARALRFPRSVPCLQSFIDLAAPVNAVPARRGLGRWG